jgi:heme/copper-type cytochrome/quinol oxidase subunit 2
LLAWDGMNYFAFSWTTMLIAVGVVLVVGALVAWGVIVLERRNRREQRSERIQQAIGEAMAAEPLLADASILPVAGFPAGTPPTLELTGYVPSAEARARAVRIAEGELRRLRPGMQVIDRLDVLPSLADRRRNTA